MSRNLVIGLVGEIGAGKETFLRILRELCQENDYFPSIGQLRFSDSLFETLRTYDVLTSRENLQELSEWLEKKKPGAITNAMRKKLESDMHEIKVVDGVRRASDENMIRELSGVLVYITADIKVRFERRRKANEKAGENKMTLEDFEKQNQAPTEVHIADIGSRADFRIDNNGDLEEYKKQLKNFYEKFIKTPS